jgi:serine/threonine protein kinase
MAFTAGIKIDAYEILSLLGAGGMGEVYRARDSVLKRDVAIKVLPSFVSSQVFGCPILRAFCERWDTTALPPRPFPRTFCYPTLRKKREGWGTRSPVTRAGSFGPGPDKRPSV